MNELLALIWKLKGPLLKLLPYVKVLVAQAAASLASAGGTEKRDWVTAEVVKIFPALARHTWLVHLAIQFAIAVSRKHTAPPAEAITPAPVPATAQPAAQPEAAQ